jgi:hypothetical protein
MPTHIRAMVQWNVGSTAPRDVMQITPCFRVGAGLLPDDPDWQSLADDLRTAVETWAFNDRKLTVKLYDIDAEPTTQVNRPKATAVSTTSNVTESSFPRELAICLSFYGGNNEPHNRGRLYLPYQFISGDDPSVRPSDAMLTQCVALGTALAALGGIDVDWIVWSPTRRAATKVEHIWADDEWDVQRRRGLLPTKRISATTGG